VRILPKNSGFGCFGAKARQNRPVEAPWRAFGFKTALELCVCKPLGVGSSLNQDSKWKFRLELKEVEIAAVRVEMEAVDAVVVAAEGDLVEGFLS
jgi:hypothetical protein